MLLFPVFATIGLASVADDFKFTDKDNVITTASGLQVADTKVGRGEEIKASQLAIVHYVLKLDDGSEIDTSRRSDRGPFSFVVGKGQVIKGWDEGLLGMRPGGTRKLRIPHTLAYGEKGIEGVIPENAILWFTVEVLAATDVASFGRNDKINTNPSGLKYCEVIAGKGDAIKTGQQAVVTYTLYNEQVEKLDSNVGAKPLAFTLGAPGIIKGFDEGTTGMKVGGMRKLRVPASLGYGSKGSGAVKPGETLWFFIELTAIR